MSEVQASRDGFEDMMPLKILIAGLPRSGTTGLFFKILNSLPPTAFGLIEPADHKEIYQSLTEEEAEKRPIVTKILCTGDDDELYRIIPRAKKNLESFERYDKKIFLVRDPRDNLISFMLYEIPNSLELIKPANAIKILALLEKKEASPKDVSVLDIFRLMNRLNRSDFIALSQERRQFSMTYLERHHQYFLLKYEDFVDGKLGPLEQYLGFSARGQAQVHDMFSDVPRTKKSGDWKNWFLQEDVDCFRPLFTSYMQQYGYPEDWAVSVEPVILPENGSRFVKAALNKFYEKNGDDFRIS